MGMLKAKEEIADIKSLERRDWQLWIVAIVAILVFSLGLAGVLLPPILWRVPLQAAFPFPVQLFYGFVGLSVLLALYLVERQLTIKRLRRRLVHELLEAELNKQLAIIDHLSGVYNRRYLDDVVAREGEMVRRHNRSLGLVLADIDAFKKVNDRYGLMRGDELLKATAQFLKGKVRSSDMVFRFGGDEFLIILPETTDPAPVVDRLRQALSEWKLADGPEPKISLSFGHATWDRSRDFSQALRAADDRLFHEKSMKGEARRSVRVFVQMPVLVRGTDKFGFDFEEETETLSLGKYGACIRSRRELSPGSTIDLVAPHGTKLRAKVLWNSADQVGVECPELAPAVGFNFP